MYTTNADSNSLFACDLTASASLSVQFRPAGTLLKTINLVNCTGNCDGLEYIAAGGHRF